jgi:plasmid stability protein
MGSLTIPDFDDELKATLEERAARHGRSPAEEARAILRGALAPAEDATVPPARNFAEYARELFGPLGGVELELPPREPARDPPDFSE